MRGWLFRQEPSVRTEFVDLGGRSVPVTVRRSAKARRLILRVAFDTGDVVVTIPKGTPFEHGLVMAQTRADWILQRLDRLPPQVGFTPGAVIPVLGEDHRVVHRAERVRGVRQVDGQLLVGGHRDTVEGAVSRWFRAEARRQISALADAKAGQIGACVGGIAVRDTRTRWGSCSSSGVLSFSWRLIMAPEFVLDYVVAHEVSHLRVRGHSQEFWKLAEELSEDLPRARAWLARHGHTLHRFG